MIGAASFPTVSYRDAGLTILVANAPVKEGESDLLLAKRVSNFIKSIFVRGEKDSWIKRFFGSVEPLDKGLKFAKAVIETNCYVEGREPTNGEKTAGKYITDVRGGFVCIKVLTGIPVMIELFKKFLSHFVPQLRDAQDVDAKKKDFDLVACTYDFLALSSFSLFETANLSKGMNFIAKYVEYGSSRTKKFCGLFPKIFFGLHISSTVQHLLGLYYDRRNYLNGIRNRFQPMWTANRENDANRVTSFDKIRAHELGYMKSTVCRITMLVKNTFEFLGDAASFTRICKPLAIASLMGVAVIDLTAELLSLKG